MCREDDRCGRSRGNSVFPGRKEDGESRITHECTVFYESLDVSRNFHINLSVKIAPLLGQLPQKTFCCFKNRFWNISGIKRL